MAKYEVKLTGILDEQQTSKKINDAVKKVNKQVDDIKIEVNVDNLKQENKYISTEFTKLANQRKKLEADVATTTLDNNKKINESIKEVLSEKEKQLNLIVEQIKKYGYMTDEAIKAQKAVHNLNNEVSRLNTEKGANNKIASYDASNIEAIKKELTWSKNEEVKVTNQLITLESKLSNSRKLSNSIEAKNLQSLLSQQKDNIRLYREEIKLNGKNSEDAITYRENIENTNREIKVQQTSIKALENTSLNVWERLTEKARDYFNYAIAAAALQKAGQAIRSMIDNVVALDTSLVELRKVTDLEGESLDNFIDKAYDASSKVARTGKEMIDATTEFAKSGYNPDAALELGEIALMYGNIADEEVSAGEAANFIIAQMKAFNIEAKDATHIIDAVNEVSNNFAVSSADIANNLGKASAVMANAGNSMEEYIAMMTAITEITRSADKAANGLKTLTLRLQGMNDEGEKDLEVQANMEALFNKLHISVYKANGELKNTYEIMETLAPVYKNLNNAQKAYVTETIAGKYQAQNAAALLQNWTTAVKANETAIRSQGSALKENEKVLDSIKGKANKFQSEFEKLSKDIISEDLIKSVIDLGTTLLKVANNDTVQFIAKMTALVTILSLLSKTTLVKTVNALLSLAATEGTTATATFALELALEKLNQSAFGRLIISIGTYIKMLYTVAVTQGATTAATIAFKGALDLISAHPVIFALTAIIGALSLMKAHTQALRDEIDELKSDLDGLSTISNRLSEISTELDNENITISEQQTLFKEIKDIQQKLRKEYQLNTSELNTQTGTIQDQVKALKEYVELKEREKNSELLEKTINLGPTKSFGEAFFDPAYMFGVIFNTKEAQQKTKDSIDAYKENIITYAKGSSKELQEAFNEFESSITDDEITSEKLNERSQNVINAINNSKLSDEVKNTLRAEADKMKNDYEDALKSIFDGQKIEQALKGNFSGVINTLITGADADYGNGIKIHMKSALEAGLDSDWFREQIKKIANEKGFADINIIDELGLRKDGNWDYLNSIIKMSDALNIPLETILNTLISLYPELASVTDMTTQARTQFELLAEQLDNIQEAYNTVKDALEEYNENGYFSIDTLDKLLGLTDEQMNALMDENGKIRDNTDAFKVLTEAKLDDIQASEDARYYNELLKLAQLDEAGAAQLAAGSIDAHNNAMAGQEVNAQALRDQIEKNIKEFNKESAAALKAAYDIAEARHIQNNSAIDKTRAGVKTNLSKSLGRNSKSSKSSSKSGKEWWEKELDNLKDQFKYNEITIEEYIAGLDKLLGKTKKGSEAWKKINEELQKQRLAKVEDDYKAGRISLEQYIAKLRELTKAYKEGTEAWNNLAEKIKKGLQDQAKETKTSYDDAKSAIDKVIDDEIDKLQDEIDLLKEKNDEKERDIELTRLQDALENAKRNKTKRVWNGSEWVWMADQDAIDDAQKALDDFLLEDKTEALQKQIDDLNELKNQYADVTKIYDQEQQKQQLIAMLGANAEADILNQRIDTLNRFKDKYISIQKQIAYYDKATPESLVGNGSSSSSSSSSSSGSSSSSKSSSSLSSAQIDKLAKEVIAGKYGNGQARKNALGANYSAVQKRVNQMLSGRSYASGGIVDYTGLAMLHGSPSRPEVVMNYDQIKNLMASVTRPSVQSNISNAGQSIIYNFSGDFNLPNVDNAQKFLRDLKAQVNIKRHSL